MSLSAKQEISQLLGENAAFECFALMPFYDIVSFTAAAAITGYRNSSVSFCNTALLLISVFFSAPLANQKEARYNMTRRTKTVILKEERAWLLPITRLSSSARRC